MTISQASAGSRSAWAVVLVTVNSCLMRTSCRRLEKQCFFV